MAKHKILRKAGVRMKAGPGRGKSARQSLLDSYGDLIDSAAQNMSDEEFKKAEKSSNEILDRAIAAHSRRRDTA